MIDIFLLFDISFLSQTSLGRSSRTAHVMTAISKIDWLHTSHLTLAVPCGFACEDLLN